MTNFVVTGKLGGGKTLACVDRINWALAGKRKVATNLDLHIHRLPTCSKRTKNARVVRLPDRPCLGDLQAIGFGMEGVRSLEEATAKYDENKFGVLILDECGTWLNAREWNEEGRREMIDYLLHIRKYLWDVYFIIQDVSALDKQVRKMLAEHVVYCRRMDRMSIPLIGWIGRLWRDKPLTFGKLHVGIVKYGDQPQSLTVDRWLFRGKALYSAYQTTQVFSPSYPHGVMSILPPWYVFHRSFVKWDAGKVMRLTKIVWRRWSRPVSFAAGAMFGVWVLSFLIARGQPGASPAIADQAAPLAPGSEAARHAASEAGPPLLTKLTVSSFWDDGMKSDVLFSADGVDYRQHELAAVGVSVARIGRCAWRLDHDKHSRTVGCWP